MAASKWLKRRLREALMRNPIDAAGDAEVLAALLRARCKRVLEAAMRKQALRESSGAAGDPAA